MVVNPAYGVDWNPAIHRVVARQHRHVSRTVVLPAVVASEASVNPFASGSSKFAKSGSNMFDLVAQVTEIPLPALVKRTLGPRYSADFIAGRFDCAKERGFTVATSIGTEKVAEAAGVKKGQELCFSAMMIAPYRGEWNGTSLHIVTHFDPQVSSKALQSIVHASVPQSLRKMIMALHRKAQEVQARGSHPHIAC